MIDQFVRSLDLQAFDAFPIDERVVRPLLEGTGVAGCKVSLIRTPPGGGSPEGLHRHSFDQIFVVLEGEMTVRIGAAVAVAVVGSVVTFPAGVPHENWNAGEKPTVHLSIVAPVPAAGEAFATPVVDE
jgi:quercetin dioxygenase-like cupin family protein